MNRIPCTLAGLAFALPALALSSPALAAADYYVEIDGVEGEAASSIEIESWSWGASNPAPAGQSANLNLSKSNINKVAPPGEPLPENGSLRVITPAKPSSAQAKASNLNSSRSNVYRQGPVAADPPPQPVETSNLNLSKSNINRQKPSADTVRICAVGKHFPRATLTGQSLRWELKEVIVTSCAADGMTLRYASAARITPAPAETTHVKSKSNITNN